MRYHVAIRCNAGDAPGLIRVALDRLRDLGSDFTNSDLYYDPCTNEDAASFSVTASFEHGANKQALQRELDRITEDVLDSTGMAVSGGLRARLIDQAVDQIERAAHRLAGTARLVPPPRVDYDAPEGAGRGYDTLRPFSRFDQRMLDAVSAVLGPLHGKRVLDVGCGTGRFSVKLAEAGALVTGLDASATMLEAARCNAQREGLHVDFVRGDANAALPAGPFDAVTAFYCAQYLSLQRFCTLAFGVLKTNGIIAIATFPHRHFAETEYARFFPSLAATDMARFPSVPALRAALARAGFRAIAVREEVVTIDDDPKQLIERVRNKYLSSFHLLSDEEFNAGLAVLEADWRDLASVRRVARGVVVSGRIA